MTQNEDEAELITMIEATIKFLIFGEGDADKLIHGLQVIRTRRAKGLRTIPILGAVHVRTIEDGPSAPLLSE